MPKHDLKPRVKFDAKGRILIPGWIREELKIEEGRIGEIEVYGKDKILVTLLGGRKENGTSLS